MIVSMYTPAATDAVDVRVIVEVKGGVPEFGLKEAVTPAGAPVTVSETACAVPDTRYAVTA
jgi:hypothetical protein